MKSLNNNQGGKVVEHELLKFSKKGFEHYKNRIKGNNDTTYGIAQRKMTRNMLLADKLYDGEKKAIYQFGSLRFEINKLLNSIEWITNHNIPVPGWKLNKTLFLKLSKELGIKDNTYMKLVAKEAKYVTFGIINKFSRLVNNVTHSRKEKLQH